MNTTWILIILSWVILAFMLLYSETDWLFVAHAIYNTGALLSLQIEKMDKRAGLRGEE
jgi:hypothetical protein